MDLLREEGGMSEASLALLLAQLRGQGVKCWGCSRSGQHAAGLGSGTLVTTVVASLWAPPRLTTITALLWDEEMQGTALQEGCEFMPSKKIWKNPGVALVGAGDPPDPSRVNAHSRGSHEGS